MSIWFLWAMTALNALAAGSLLSEREYALAIMCLCYAIATAAMTWMVK